MPKTRKDEDRDRPQPSRLLAMTIISSPKIHGSSTRRHREGRRDPGAAETTRRGRGHVRHDPPSPDGKHGAVGSGTRTRPTAPPPAPCAPRTLARRLPDPRPRQAPSAPVWRGGARRAPKRPPGGDMHAGRKAEGGPSRVPMGFWNLEVEDYFIFIQIYRRFHFSGEKLTDRLLPPPPEPRSPLGTPACGSRWCQPLPPAPPPCPPAFGLTV